VYDWLVPNLVYPLYERISGQRFWSERQRLARLQWLSADELQARSAVRLQRLVEHAATQVPYYRDLFAEVGVGAGDVRSVQDLSKIPPTTKATLRANYPARTVAQNVSPERRWKVTTSGSSGEPFEMFADRAGLDSWLGSFFYFLQDLAGVPAWQSRIQLGGYRPLTANVAGLPSAPSRLRRLAFGQSLERLPDREVSVEAFCGLVARLGRRPYWIWAVPSLASHLAGALLASSIELPVYPTIVMSSGESLTKPQAYTIRQAFRCRIVDHFVVTETPHIAQSCPDQPDRFHVNSERAILRIVGDDGTDVGPGEVGRVLLTDLSNYAMPLVNYELADRAVAADTCPCGRGFPTVASIEGRVSEMLRTPSGTVLSGPTVASIMYFVPDLVESIVDFQVAQVAPDAVVVRLIPSPAFSEKQADHIRQALGEQLGGEVRVEVQRVDRIPREPSGKRLMVRTEYADSAPAAVSPANA
jgi:phenylacetate-CoA ligase